MAVFGDEQQAVNRNIERFDTLVFEDGNEDYDSNDDDGSEGAVGGRSDTYNPSPQK